MDLNTISRIDRPRQRQDLVGFTSGDAYLAGGTWLFSEPQPDKTRLIDLHGLGWPALVAAPTGMQIAATCRIAELANFSPPPGWRAGVLFEQCCNALLGSFKIWNMATVGGNICLALPAGPMTALTVALEGVCILWQGEAERRLPVAQLVVGPQRNALRPGEVLRAIELPLEALLRRSAFRQISLSTHGRSAALLIGTRDESGFALTVTASTPRPFRLNFSAMPTAEALLARLAEAIPPDLYYDDVHGNPVWRAAMTRRFALEIREELAA